MEITINQLERTTADDKIEELTTRIETLENA